VRPGKLMMGMGSLPRGRGVENVLVRGAEEVRGAGRGMPRRGWNAAMRAEGWGLPCGGREGGLRWAKGKGGYEGGVAGVSAARGQMVPPALGRRRTLEGGAPLS